MSTLMGVFEGTLCNTGKLSRKGFCKNMRECFQTNFRVNFARDFFCEKFGAFVISMGDFVGHMSLSPALRIPHSKEKRGQG